MSAAELISRAMGLYDDVALPFARLAREEGWRNGFASGAAWMRLAMAHVRGVSIPARARPYNWLGAIKYGTAAATAMLFAALALRFVGWWLLPGAVFVFYAVEAQMVFLFPLMIDGCPNVFQQSRCWTVRAGGTVTVTWTTLQLAALMLFGGLLGRGYVRSWALGCLAVVLWYEEVRRAGDRVA
jgi:hypothetical protein